MGWVVFFDLMWFTDLLNQRKQMGFDGANQSPIKSVNANIKRGEMSMNKALVEKTTVHRAMYFQGNDDFLGGWVDFVWGDVGRVRPNGKTKGGMGLSHIIEARMRKDGLSYEEVVFFLTKTIPQVIARGKPFDYKAVGNTEVAKVQYQKNLVSVLRTKGSNAWLVTGFEVWD